MELDKLAGSIKVAILVNAIGIEPARHILNQLGDAERATIFKLQSKLDSVSPELVEKVAQEFAEKLTVQTTLAQKAIEGADSGATNSKGLLGMDEDGAPTSTIEAIQAIEPDQLVQLIKDEHPQTIALVIVHLKPAVASEVLGKIPDDIKSDVAYRIANLDKVMSGMIDEINRVFDDILKNKDQSTAQEAGGVEKLAEILNQIDNASAEQILEEIEESDPELADEIKANMFVFDDIILVDDKGLQQVLRAIESQELAVALKAAVEPVKEKIFRNMSERAVDILKEEMEVSGAVRMKEVTDAQQKVTRIIQEMERKGELVISGRGGEEFIG
jgi:flagellar motor switch protein FliG